MTVTRHDTSEVQAASASTCVHDPSYYGATLAAVRMSSNAPSRQSIKPCESR